MQINKKSLHLNKSQTEAFSFIRSAGIQNPRNKFEHFTLSKHSFQLPLGQLRFSFTGTYQTAMFLYCSVLSSSVLISFSPLSNAISLFPFSTNIGRFTFLKVSGREVSILILFPVIGCCSCREVQYSFK